MRRRGFGLPLVLIAIGLVALLANLGITSFSWVALLALWPLILVIVGIDLLLARRAPLAALALDVLAVGLGLALLLTQPNLPRSVLFTFPGGGCPGGQPSQGDVSVARAGAQRLSLQLTGGAGTFHVSGGASTLVEAHSDAGDLSARSSTSGDRADVRITQCGPIANFASRSVDVRITNDIPTSLDLTGGAGSFDLDLRDVTLADVRLTNGASSTRLALPRPSGDVGVRVAGGASSITIELPPGSEARVETSGGLTALNSPATSAGGFGRNVYETPGYAAARDRYSITVTGGVSSVTVR